MEITETKELSLDNITPTEAQLRDIVEQARVAIDSYNPDDKMSVELFKSRKKELQQARLTVIEVCKSEREEARSFAKKVINHEKQLLKTITPIEEEMKEIVEEERKKKIREERLKELPERRKMLDEVYDGDDITDEMLLELDHDQFIAFLNQKKAERLDQLEEERREREAEEKRKKEIQEAEERAAKEAVEKAEREAKEEAERKERAAKEAVEKAEREAEEAKRKLQEEEDRKKREEEERIENERKEKEEAERKAKEEAENKLYQDWLISHGYMINGDNSDFVLKNDGSKACLYKLVDTFTFEDVDDSTQ